MTLLTRRAFLIGAATLVLEAYADEEIDLTIYTALIDNKIYPVSTFQTVLKFLKQELDLKAKVVFQPILPYTLDHRTKVELTEVKPYWLAAKKVGLPPSQFELEDLAERGAHIMDPKRIEAHVPVREQWYRKWKKHFEGFNGLAQPKRGFVYLIRTVETEADFDELKTATMISKDYADLKSYDRLKAKQILHEIFHIFGLWHPDEFSNDGVDDRVGNLANVMSQKPPSREGMFGFGLTKMQKEFLSEYRNKGDVYTLFRDLEYDSACFYNAIGILRGYKPLRPAMEHMPKDLMILQ